MAITVYKPEWGENRPIRGVLFDMDGLVLDSEKLYSRFWREACGFYGFPMSYEQSLKMRALNSRAGEAMLHSFYGEAADYVLIRTKRIELMDAFVEENGVELILMKAPSVYPFWYEEYDSQIREYTQRHGLRYYNFLDHAEEIGIDYSQDTYDGGQHLNLSGAVKLSNYFAKILTREHGLEDHRNDPGIAREYTQKLARYDAQIAEQR